jgi:uncharacterized protein YecE (DUF72 family)
MIDDAAFNRLRLKERLSQLAADGIYVGTSSWKYEGWIGQLYDHAHYVYRGKFAKTRFDRNCLAEYAEVFKTVCVDAAYYQFPTEKYLQGLVNQVPKDFQFTFKVTDNITIKKFANLPRFGIRAGEINSDFLNADMFATAFLKPCEPFKENIGTLFFEFSRFYQTDYAHGRDFVADLDFFLGKLPMDWRYGVEIRNKNFLHPEYFATLRRHRVAHVLNSWSGTMPVAEQLTIPESETSDDFAAARFLLKPGRDYETAVKAFSPYSETKEVYPEARQAAKDLIRRMKEKKKKAYIYVNNRLEGNALKTISHMLS